MKFLALIFSLLLLSGSLSIAYAHPYLNGIVVQNQDGEILYQQDIAVNAEKDPVAPEPFSEEWFFHNFIWSLYGVIALTAVLGGLITHRDEINPKISKILRRT